MSESFKNKCSACREARVTFNDDVYKQHYLHGLLVKISGLLFLFSDVLPDALRTRCSSCTAIQKAKALDAITRLYYQHPDKYLALAERYDPTGEYTRNFEHWFDEENAVKPGRNEGNQFITRATTNKPRQEVRRRFQPNPNTITTERTRIPSTWITTTTIRQTTQRVTSPRPTLRTLPPTVRSIETVTSRFIPTTLPPTFRTSTRPQTFRETPTTSRFIPTTQAPTLAPTFRTTQQIFRETPTTPRYFASPVTQQISTVIGESEVRDIPRSLQAPIEPPVFSLREPEVSNRQPTTSRPILTQPSTALPRTEPPAIFKEIQTILRAPAVSSFIPDKERIPQPTFTQPTTTSRPVTTPFTQQTQPPSVIAKEPPIVLRLPDIQPPQVFRLPEQREPIPVFRDPPTILRAPTAQPQTIPLTFRPQPVTTRAQTQAPVYKSSPEVFAAPDTEGTQPRFGDSEPRTREIFTDSQPNRTVSILWRKKFASKVLFSSPLTILTPIAPAKLSANWFDRQLLRPEWKSTLPPVH